MAALRHPIESNDDLDSPEGVTYLTGPAALEFFEREIQRLMGMSGEEFIRRYDAGSIGHWRIFLKTGMCFVPHS